MSKLDNGMHYFQTSGGYGDIDQGLGYVSIKNDCLHAVGKPARINQEGSTWMVNGKLHREDGPAIENKDGHQEWYLNGKKHRIGGACYYFC